MPACDTQRPEKQTLKRFPLCTFCGVYCPNWHQAENDRFGQMLSFIATLEIAVISTAAPHPEKTTTQPDALNDPSPRHLPQGLAEHHRRRMRQLRRV
jgi:hypothetical protein